MTTVPCRRTSMRTSPCRACAVVPRRCRLSVHAAAPKLHHANPPGQPHLRLRSAGFVPFWVFPASSCVALAGERAKSAAVVLLHEDEPLPPRPLRPATADLLASSASPLREEDDPAPSSSSTPPPPANPDATSSCCRRRPAGNSNLHGLASSSSSAIAGVPRHREPAPRPSDCPNPPAPLPVQLRRCLPSTPTARSSASETRRPRPLLRSPGRPQAQSAAPLTVALTRLGQIYARPSAPQPHPPTCAEPS